jgi:hypothetical protein
MHSKMNYKNLESKINIRYYPDKIKVITALGYSYVSEAVIDMYVNQQKPMTEIAEGIEVTSACIQRWLKIWGIQRRSRGGDTQNFEEKWGKFCLLCNKPTMSHRRAYGMHDGCWHIFKKRTKHWIIKYTRSEEGLTRLKADLGIVHPVDDQLLISVLNR